MTTFCGHFFWTLLLDTFCGHFLTTLFCVHFLVKINCSPEIMVNKRHNEKLNYFFLPKTPPFEGVRFN